MNLTTRFTEEIVSLAKSYCDNADEAAAPEGGGSFAEHAMISLHGLRIFLDETYEMLIDRLEVMSPILEIVGLEPDDLPHPSTVNKWLDKIVMQVWRVLLRHSAQLHEPSPHLAVDATYYERSPASKHYCDRTDYRVQTVEATKLVDTETRAILECIARPPEKEVTRTCVRNSPAGTRASCRPSSPTRTMTASRCEKPSARWGIRLLVKHRVFAPYDHAHDARIEDDFYNQRSMIERVNSSVKRSYDSAVRAREWYREFREAILMCLVYSIKQYVTA